MHQNPNVAAGIIFLASELVREKPGLSTLMLGRTNISDGGDDSKDCLEVPNNDNDDNFSEVKQFGAKTKGGIYVSMRMNEESTCLREDAQGKAIGEGSPYDPAMAEATQITTTTSSPDNNCRKSYQTSYDPYHRNPLFAGSENTSLWELRHLKVSE